MTDGPKAPRRSRKSAARKSGPQTSEQIATDISQLGKAEAADILEQLDDATAAAVLQQINPAVVGDIIPELEAEKREDIFAAAPAGVTRQWSLNLSFEDESVGRLMETPPIVFSRARPSARPRNGSASCPRACSSRTASS